jgi:epoxide hydrolase-like predicted phosphatase
MIRAVISDFGGVLTTPLIESFLGYQDHSGITLEQLGVAMSKATERADGVHPLFELEKGRITEREFLDQVELELGEPLSEFRETWFAHLRPNEPMIERMRALKGRGMRMALLTNNVREWEPHWRAKLPDVDDVFELVVDSAFVGMRKPDPAIYELTLERLGDVSAEECVFVDDVDVNCHAARELGMQTVHFVENEQALAELDELLGP